MQISPISAFKAINFRGFSEAKEPKSQDSLDYSEFERVPEEDTFSKNNKDFFECYRKTGHMAEAVCGDYDDCWDE